MAKLFSREFMIGDSIRLRAVDLEEAVRPGATNIVLATVIFGNTKQGEGLIELTVRRMDDDDGNPITPSIEPGKLTVIGPPTQTVTTGMAETIETTLIITTITVTAYIPTTIVETITTTIEKTITTTTTLSFPNIPPMLLSMIAIVVALMVLIISLTALKRKGMG